MAIYLEVPSGGMLGCGGGWPEALEEGNWLYEPGDLPGNLISVNEVEIMYIEMKT